MAAVGIHATSVPALRRAGSPATLLGYPLADELPHRFGQGVQRERREQRGDADLSSLGPGEIF
jgi:hypothetical protein